MGQVVRAEHKETKAMNDEERVQAWLHREATGEPYDGHADRLVAQFAAVRADAVAYGVRHGREQALRECADTLTEVRAALSDIVKGAEWALAGDDPYDWRKGLEIVRDRARHELANVGEVT